MLPVAIGPSPNGLSLLILYLCRDNPNVSMIKMDGIKLDKTISKQLFGNIVPKLKDLIMITYYNQNDASDLGLILSQLKSLSDFDIIQEISPQVFLYFKKPNLSLFDINTASSVVGDCVMVQHLLLSYYKFNQIY